MKPILFSGPLVRAILDGRKTQTRRVLKSVGDMDRVLQMDDGSWHVTDSKGGHMSPVTIPYPVGTELWVRESFADTVGMGFDKRYHYAADVKPGSESDQIRKDYGVKWKPSIHMPRAASRITLRVTAVKVERLQDISEEDAKAEGVTYEAPTKEDYDWYETFCEENGGDPTAPMDGVWKCEGVKGWGPTPETMYRVIWESINGPGSWDANPWVVAYSFERVLPK